MSDAARKSVIESIELHGRSSVRTGAGGSTGDNGGDPIIRTSGIILAGVHQWRASAFERRLPRTLVPIANRALVDYPLDWLGAGGVGGIRICANSDTAALRRHLGDGASRNLDIDYYEDHMPRGPAGCVADASAESASDCVLVIEGTVIPERLDTAELIAAHLNGGAALTVAVARPNHSSTMEDRLAPAGIYVFSRAALEHVAPRGYVDIKEMLIPRLFERGLGVDHFELVESPLRITGANSCFVATRRILTRYYASREAPEGYEWRGAAIVHRSAQVDAAARIDGPCLIGPNARIEAGAIVIGPTTVGESAIIHGGAVVCRSIIWDKTVIDVGAYVDRAILTSSARANAGESVAGRIVHALTNVEWN